MRKKWKTFDLLDPRCRPGGPAGGDLRCPLPDSGLRTSGDALRGGDLFQDACRQAVAGGQGQGELLCPSLPPAALAPAAGPGGGAA